MPNLPKAHLTELQHIHSIFTIEYSIILANNQLPGAQVLAAICLRRVCLIHDCHKCIEPVRPQYYERETLKNSIETIKNENNIEIPEECMNDFVKAMKIGYYKELHKQGLITDRQLEILIEMNTVKIETTDKTRNTDNNNPAA